MNEWLNEWIGLTLCSLHFNRHTLLLHRVYQHIHKCYIYNTVFVSFKLLYLSKLFYKYCDWSLSNGGNRYLRQLHGCHRIVFYHWWLQLCLIRTLRIFSQLASGLLLPHDGTLTWRKVFPDLFDNTSISLYYWLHLLCSTYLANDSDSEACKHTEL